MSCHFLGFRYKYFLQIIFVKHPEFYFFGMRNECYRQKENKIVFYTFSNFNIPLFLEETEK